MIESFSFDHTKIKQVPYVRLSKQIQIPGSSQWLRKYDIRFTWPNREYLSMPVMHAMEHILSGELDTWCAEVGLTYVDFSPMGCQTGFYFAFICAENQLSVYDEQALCEVIERLCHKLCGYAEVPYAKPEECGNYRSFDLAEARRICEHIHFRPFEPGE